MLIRPLVEQNKIIMSKNNNLPNKKLFHTIIASSVGTILEWYDFSLYIFFAPFFGALFFPNKNHATSVMLTYSVFAIGFIVRPIGAILFGHFGDRCGRKKALIRSLTLMASTTCLIGVLPTYSQIGIIAPGLLIFLRILQGISIGGETIGAGLFVIESAQKNKRGFATSLVWASSGLGILLSSLAVTMVTFLFDHDELLKWGWRLPFLFGAITCVLGYFLRARTTESTSFNSLKLSNNIVKYPLIEAIKNSKTRLLIAMGLYALSVITTYLFFVFMPNYVSTTTGLALSVTMAVNTITMAVMVFLVPFFGSLSDKIGRRIILLLSGFGIIILALPLFLLISTGALIALIIAQLTFAILAAGFQGPITSAVLELFPVNTRYSAAAFSYGLSSSIFGGTTPLIALFLIHTMKSNIAPSMYLILGAVLAVISAMKMNALKAEQ